MNRVYVEGNVLRNRFGKVFLCGANVRGQAYNPLRDVGEGWKGTGFDDPFTYAAVDAAFLKSFGFNCIRTAGVYWSLLETSRTPDEFTYNAEYLNAIKQLVQDYNAQGIYVILDLHRRGTADFLSRFLPMEGSRFSDEFFTDTSPISAREHLKKVWLLLSNNFKGNASIAGYDFVNEPFHTGTLSLQQVSDSWQDIVDYVTQALRANGDSHVIMPSLTPWARNMSLLSRRFLDPNTIYQPHAYQGTDGGGTILTTDITQIRLEFNEAICEPATSLKVPVVLGEMCAFGTLTAETDEYLRNLLTVARECPHVQGFLYYAFYSYGGNPQPVGWETILKEFTPEPAPVEMSAGMILALIIIILALFVTLFKGGEK